MGKISFNFLVNFEIVIDESVANRVIEFASNDLGYKIGIIEFNFVSKSEILKINEEFLKHNYYTDIITFDSTFINIINGEIFISPEVVKENASDFKVSFASELYRVIIHGVIHLCGFNDSTNDEITTMRFLENKYLNYLEKL